MNTPPNCGIRSVTRAAIPGQGQQPNRSAASPSGALQHALRPCASDGKCELASSASFIGSRPRPTSHLRRHRGPGSPQPERRLCRPPYRPDSSVAANVATAGPATSSRLTPTGPHWRCSSPSSYLSGIRDTATPRTVPPSPMTCRPALPEATPAPAMTPMSRMPSLSSRPSCPPSRSPSPQLPPDSTTTRTPKRDSHPAPARHEPADQPRPPSQPLQAAWGRTNDPDAPKVSSTASGITRPTSTAGISQRYCPQPPAARDELHLDGCPCCRPILFGHG